ncbi:uncharacterized protein AMSG_12185 [Thecamonas trahens ATCC 50062]|uniref:N-acetyltransferase domain-containing protein n=1 Tax=Thecamonas trahens ATCC 50062 TaxID=461836 RepID=A0A0L0DKA0_THETB|nr:hypothetical protein AMSG_12185 [Thecamonas trahens ATCC 50062]KNC52712.1 hypothetical protein AMSG_12185 [Thecamonas trahens ATCC 50062]|eukprot:XP_013755127.1 hypothetical protein AMSG_12185 [Thecamonas trahens ATCC 50062]
MASDNSEEEFVTRRVRCSNGDDVETESGGDGDGDGLLLSEETEAVESEVDRACTPEFAAPLRSQSAVVDLVASSEGGDNESLSSTRSGAGGVGAELAVVGDDYAELDAFYAEWQPLQSQSPRAEPACTTRESSSAPVIVLDGDNDGDDDDDTFVDGSRRVAHFTPMRSNGSNECGSSESSSSISFSPPRSQPVGSTALAAAVPARRAASSLSTTTPGNKRKRKRKREQEQEAPADRPPSRAEREVAAQLVRANSSRVNVPEADALSELQVLLDDQLLGDDEFVEVMDRVLAELAESVPGLETIPARYEPLGVGGCVVCDREVVARRLAGEDEAAAEYIQRRGEHVAVAHDVVIEPTPCVLKYLGHGEFCRHVLAGTLLNACRELVRAYPSRPRAYLAVGPPPVPGGPRYPRPSGAQIQAAVVAIELELQVTVQQTGTRGALAFLLRHFFRHVANSAHQAPPYALAALGLHLDASTVSKSRKPSEIWISMLMQIPRVSKPVALAIARVYPTLNSLLVHYERRDLSDADKASLLASIHVSSTVSSARSRSRSALGPALSHQIYTLLTTLEPDLHLWRQSKCTHCGAWSPELVLRGPLPEDSDVRVVATFADTTTMAHLNHICKDGMFSCDDAAARRMHDVAAYGDGTGCNFELGIGAEGGVGSLGFAAFGVDTAPSALVVASTEEADELGYSLSAGLVGFRSLSLVAGADGVGGSGEIGIAIHASLWGKRIGLRALVAVLDFAFTPRPAGLGLERVIGSTKAANKGMLATFAKLGLEYSHPADESEDPWLERSSP